jgi:hypothetical protein
MLFGQGLHKVMESRPGPYGRRAATNQLASRECEARPVHGVQDLVDSGLSNQIRLPSGGDGAAKSHTHTQATAT